MKSIFWLFPLLCIIGTSMSKMSAQSQLDYISNESELKFNGSLVQSLHSVVKNDDNQSFRLVEDSELISLVIDAPAKNQLENEMAIELLKPTPNVLFSIDQYYNICQGVGCENQQIIEVYGVLNDEGPIYPEVILNSGNELGLEVKAGQIIINKVYNDDILLFFERPISKIVVKNSKSSSTGFFKPFLKIGSITELKAFGVKKSILTNQDVCRWEKIHLSFDVSNSIDADEKTAALEMAYNLLSKILNTKQNIKVSVDLVAANKKQLLKGQVVQEITDLDAVFSKIDISMDAFAKEDSGWTNWEAVLTGFKSEDNTYHVLFTDGVPNGDFDGRIKLVNNLPQSNIYGDIVSLNNQINTKLYPVISSNDYTTAIDELITGDCQIQTLDARFEMSLTPNPVLDRTAISLKRTLGKNPIKITLQNEFGQIVQEWNLTTESSLEISLSDQAAGMYFIVAQDEMSNFEVSQKLIKL